MKKILLLLGWVACNSSALAKGDPRAGEAKAMACVACHGIRGKASVPLYPNIGGQSEAYLAHSLQAYKKGERSGGQAEIMKAYVSGLSEEDASDLAAYYASMTP